MIGKRHLQSVRAVDGGDSAEGGASRGDGAFRSGVRPPKRIGSAAFDAELLSLYMAICKALPDTRNRVVQFVGPSGGEGTSTIIWQLARLLVERVGHRASIVTIRDEEGGGVLSAIGDGDAAVASLPQRVQPGERRGGQIVPVHIAPLQRGTQCTVYSAGSFFPLADLLEASQWTHIRQSAEMTLVDCSAADRSRTAPVFGDLVDGVVLVVEAERTSIAEAKETLARMERCGATCLGVVVNRTKRHVPRFLERWI